MRGAFILYPNTPREIIVPNMITDEGEESFLKMITRADVSEVSSGGNWYIGLTNVTPAETHDLTDIVEPSAGGYARQAVARNSTGWPTIEAVGSSYRALTQQVNFAASGAAFNIAVARAFLCNVASGTSGRLFAYSGAFSAPITVGDGETLPLVYALYAK